jgi:hypothetical protein
MFKDDYVTTTGKAYCKTPEMQLSNNGHLKGDPAGTGLVFPYQIQESLRES